VNEPEERRAPRRRIWLRGALVLVVVVALGAVATTAFSAEMREANDETAEVAGATLAIRVERVRLASVLADTRADLDRVWDERTVRRAQRVNLDAKLETLYSKLLGLNDELTELVTTSQLHVLNLGRDGQPTIPRRGGLARLPVSWDTSPYGLALVPRVAPSQDDDG